MHFLQNVLGQLLHRQKGATLATPSAIFVVTVLIHGEVAVVVKFHAPLADSNTEKDMFVGLILEEEHMFDVFLADCAQNFCVFNNSNVRVQFQTEFFLLLRRLEDFSKSIRDIWSFITF
uniref:Thioredoxin-like protein ydbP n=1 Tax=Lygus hesperus TaxID=30085 RepID=A0A0A9X6C1_LYGHE